MSHSVIDTGESRSFPAAHPLLAQAAAGGEVVLVIGRNVARGLSQIKGPAAKQAIVLELGTECLGTYTGESRGEEGSNMVGFARFRLGDAEPSNLIELVRQPRTQASALDAAKAVFEGAGLQVAVCNDFAGRIIDRLVRPYYNAALRRLDEGLATADDMDTTLRIGLGYPEGPIALLERTGLAHHFDVTRALFETYGEAPYAPARRACVAKQRSGTR